MNIIANDCAGGYIYKDCLKVDFMNPFIWSSIDINNFTKLISLYDNINFKNIRCELILNDSGICKNGTSVPKIIIDDKIDILYFHYILNEKYITPTKIDGYTMCKDIKQYTIDCYLRRVEKMNEDPIFIWDVTRCHWYNKTSIDPVSTFKEIESKYKIIIYSPTLKDNIDGKIITLNKVNKCFEVNTSGHNIYQKYLKSHG